MTPLFTQLLTRLIFRDCLAHSLGGSLGILLLSDLLEEAGNVIHKEEAVFKILDVR